MSADRPLGTFHVTTQRGRQLVSIYEGVWLHRYVDQFSGRVVAFLMPDQVACLEVEEVVSTRFEAARYEVLTGIRSAMLDAEHTMEIHP